MYQSILPWAKISFSDRWFADKSVGYEHELLRFMEGNNDCTVDVGAHQGYYTTFLARYRRHVYAFEPNPENYVILKGNVEGNGLSNVSLIEKAVSNFDGEGILYCYDVNGGQDSGKHFLRGSTSKEAFYHEYLNGQPVAAPQWGSKVQVCRLDSYSIVGCDLIKIDVEGAEVRVLMGAVNLLKNCCPRLVIEVHHGQQKEILDVVEPLGYLVTAEGKMRCNTNPFMVCDMK